MTVLSLLEWLSGLVVRALDLRLDGHEFDYRSPRQPLGQLSLLPSAGLEMSTGQSLVMLGSWEKRQAWLIPLVDEHVGGR